MKTKNILSSLIILIALYFGANGCNNNPVNSTNTQHKTLSEQEFANPNLRAEHGSLIIVDLEHLNSPPRPGSYDTETTGIDAIPIRYIETEEHSFRLDESANFELRLLKDPSEEEVFLLTPASPEITINIPAGDYVLLFKSLKTYGSDATSNQTVFFQHDKRRHDNDGANFREQLITSNKCDSCIFNNLKLDNVKLQDISLISSTFNNADISNSTVININMQRAVINRTNISHTYMTNVDMERSKISEGSVFSYGSFRNLNFSYADISNSTFSDMLYDTINFSYANINSCIITATQSYHIEPIFAYTSNFSNANLRKNTIAATFFGAKLLNVDMSESNLKGSSFTSCDISGSKFNKADISKIWFQSVRAYDTDFCGCIATGTYMFNVLINDGTKCFIWPHH